MNLYDELQQKTKELDISIKSLRKSGTQYAEAERTYKLELRIQSLKLRNDGMAVTLINQIVYGIQEVANARFKRDVAETVFIANKEAINSIKLQLRLIDGQLSREWTNAK